MSVLVFIDLSEGKIKKSSFEAACYAADTARLLSLPAKAAVLGSCSEDLSILGAYGISEVHHLNHDSLQQLDARNYTEALAAIAQTVSAAVIIFSGNTTGKAVAPRLSVKLKAGLVSGAVALPDTSNGFVVKKSVFSGKAFAHISINSAVKIISINPNSYHIQSGEGKAAVINTSAAVGASNIQLKAVNKVTGDVPLSEAEIVVSGGRGLKGPENWGMVTELASLLGAATACSRPVADVHWRPHHEHVGQTGLAIAPNLYIAIGISGAIQHLAGVNRSKTIVVINKDPEAPFFKAADYGIVGDAFEVVPKMIEAVKNMKG